MKKEIIARIKELKKQEQQTIQGIANADKLLKDLNANLISVRGGVLELKQLLKPKKE